MYKVLIAFLSMLVASFQGLYSQSALFIGSDFYIGESSTLFINGNFKSESSFNLEGTLAIAGDLSFDSGDLSEGGRIKFSGSGSQNLSMEDSSTIESSIIIDKSSGEVQMTCSIFLKDTLFLENGIFNTGNYMLDLDKTGYISGETDENYVLTGNDGAIRAYRLLNKPDQADPAGMGIAITSPANMGWTELQRVHTTTDLGGGITSCGRMMKVDPAVDINLFATFRMYYRESELDGLEEAGMQFFRSADEGASWSGQFGFVNPTQNYVQLINIPSFSWWTIGPSAAVLPVEWLYLDASVTDQSDVMLNWATAMELNASHYEIEHTTDGVSFEKIGEVSAEGNTLEQSNYQFIHSKPGPGNHYYRIRQVDENLEFSLSEVAQIKIEGSPEVHIFPNPVINSDYITLSGVQGASSFSMINVAGKTMLEQALNPNALSQQIAIEGLGPGLYKAVVQFENHFEVNSIIIY